MNCTSCNNGTLYPSFIEGQFRSHTCSSCEGNWVLIEDYIENQLKLIQAYVLIDARVGLKNSDIDMFDLLSESNRKFSIVFTKIDKCSKSYLEELESSMQSLMKSYNKHFSQFFFTSAKKFEGIIDIQKDIYALSKQ